MPKSAVATAARWMNSRRPSMGSPPRGTRVVTHPQFVTFLKSRDARLAHSISGGAMAKESFGPREFAHSGSRRQGQGYRRAAKELAKEVQGRAPLLPARPPHRHQHGLRSGACPGPAATPDLAQDD